MSNPCAGPKVMVDSLTTELLYTTDEAMGYWAHGTQGSLTSGSTTGRVHMQSELSRGGGTTKDGSWVVGMCGNCIEINGI